jgi:hypothetical protein
MSLSFVPRHPDFSAWHGQVQVLCCDRSGCQRRARIRKALLHGHVPVVQHSVTARSYPSDVSPLLLLSPLHVRVRVRSVSGFSWFQCQSLWERTRTQVVCKLTGWGVRFALRPAAQDVQDLSPCPVASIHRVALTIACSNRCAAQVL